MTNPWKKAAIVATALLGLVLTTAGCEEGGTTNWNVTGVEGKKPDKIEGFANVDGHPNIVVLCIHKVAWITTSGGAGNNLVRVPEYDVPVCGGVESKWAPTTSGYAADPVPSPAG